MTDPDRPPVEAVAGRAAYDVPFVEESSHGHMVALLEEHARPGLIVDIGCGYAPHAEPLRERGFEYVGVDADEAAVASLRQRGFAAVLADADRPDTLVTALDDVVEQARDAGAEAGTDREVTIVSAVLALDVLEHLVSPHLTLASMVEWMRGRSVPVLGLSLPNVSHQDVALKLLAGRFDMTPTGLLDETHLRFFTDRSIGDLAARAGVEEIARHDVRSPKSDQDWPVMHPMLSDGALLGTYLRGIRARGDDHGTTFQFVRLFTPIADHTPDASPTLLAPRPGSIERAITVLVLAGASDADVEATRRQVDEQATGTAVCHVLGADDDLGVVLAGVTTAYVTVVRGGDRLSPEWASSVLSVADRYPAATIRSGSLDGAWAERFAPFDHYVDDATPGAALAFPAAFLRDVSTLPPTDPSDVDTHGLLLEASTVCGVVDTGVPSVAVRPGWARSTGEIDATVERLSGGALLAPVGAAREIARLRRAELDLVATRAELERRHGEIAGLNAELARRPVRIVRRAANVMNRVLRRT